MPIRLHSCIALSVFTVIAAVTNAEEESVTEFIQTLETSVLEPEVGHLGQSLGARIEAVERLEDGKMVKIEISLPEPDTSSSTDSSLEEVIVYGTQEEDERPKLEQKQEFQIINNLEEGRSGIVIYLDKRQNFVLRLNYTEPQPDVEPDLYNR